MGILGAVRWLSASTGPETPGEGRGSAYAALSREIRRAGLMHRRRVYYSIRIVATGLSFAGGWAAFGLIGSSWWQLLVAGFMAVAFTQVAFLGHDAGHRQVFRTRKANDVLGLVHGNLLVGLSYGWWVDKHTRHHAHPNEVGSDPDVSGDLIAFTAAQAGVKAGLTRAFVRYQAWLFFPLLLLEGFHLHVASVRALLTGGGTRRRGLEAVLLFAHGVGYLTAILVVLTPWQALAFVAVHQGLFGLYMGCSFAPNHKGMPPLADQDREDFLRRQVLTSRNISGGWLVDFALGGLNFQIEHHLFPSMPSPNLRRAQVVVRRFCQQHGVSYSQRGLLGSYTEVLRHLHSVGAVLRPVRSG